MQHPVLTSAIVGSLLVLSPAPAQPAVVPVIDAGNIVQSTISAIADVEMAISAATSVVNDYTQIANQVTQIVHQGTQIYNQGVQIANQVQNLQHLDVTSIGQVLQMTGSLTSTLNQARSISYRLGTAEREFDALYTQINVLLSPTDLLALRRTWAQQRRDASRTSVQVQAITTDLERTSAAIQEYLHKASAAQGNLDISQAQAQQTGLTQAQLLSIQQQLATNGRLEAQRHAEAATIEDATLLSIQEAGRPLENTYVPAGRILPMSR